ncbi:MAG: aconitase/3-isopropylmalate dehydratase large subunit family protein [bacterium]
MARETATQKILARASGRDHVSVGEIVWAKVDAHMMHDNQGPYRMGKDFKSLGLPIWNKDRFVLTADHHNPPSQDGQTQVLNVTRAFASEHQLPHFFDGEGICHILMAEKGFIRPGCVMTGTDSHTTNAGALGALGIAIGPTESIGILITGEVWLRVPETIRIEFRGKLPEGIWGKDLTLLALKDIGVDGGNYKVLQFEGDSVMSLSVEDRMTLTNMAAEFSAKSSLIEVDDKTEAYLREAGVDDDWESFTSDPDAEYAATYEYDVSDLSPQVACPHRMDNVSPIEEVDSGPVHRAHIGSCTGAKLEDLRAASRVINGRRVAHGTQLLIAPASKAIMNKAWSEGTLQPLLDAGGVLMPTTCGICTGRGPGQLGPGEVGVSSANRNYKGRMGSSEASIYLASAATVAASAVQGHVADPREFLS